MEVARPLRGHGPREHVGDQPPRAGGERRRAQVNFTVEVAIGSNVYVGELPLRRPLSVRARARSASTSC